MAIGDFFEDNFSVAATLENAEDHLEDIGGSDAELEDQSNAVNDWVEDPRVFVSRDIPFTGPQPGPVFPDLNAFEILRRFITDEMLATVVANTNSFSTSNRRQTRRRRGTGTGVEETPLTVDEMWMFIAILMLIEVMENQRSMITGLQTGSCKRQYSTGQCRMIVSEASCRHFTLRETKRQIQQTRFGKSERCSNCFVHS